MKTRTSSSTGTTQIETGMASLNISGDFISRSHDPTSRSHDGTDSSISLLANSSDISVNPLDNSVDSQDISVNPQDIDVVYLDGEGRKLCLATFNHQGQDITGCGNGDNKDTAKDDAIKNLMSNLSILYPSLHSV